MENSQTPRDNLSDDRAYEGAPTLIRSSEPLQSLGPYLIEKTIGRGGMATVFLANDQRLNRRVALKVMHQHLASNPEFVERFLHEVRATAGLKHQHIVEVLDYGEQSGQYFMACELIDGGTVHDLLRAMGKFPLPLALEVFAQLLDALAHAHARGIIHRDLKPPNMFLSRDGCLKVGDFGIAKTLGGTALTQTGMLLGTPAYMSPEQALGQRVDQRSDLYSSGIVLYELLTGSNPRDSDNPTTALSKVLNESLTLLYEVEPAIPDFVQRVLDGLLARDPKTRFGSADGVLSLLADEVGRVRVDYPHLLAECIADPQGRRRQLTHDQALRWFRRAQTRFEEGPASKEAAALWAYNAACLEPGNEEIQRLFREICTTHGLQFAASQNPKVLELEKLLRAEPEKPGVLRQLAQLYRLEGNVYRAALYLRRYLHVRPNDGYAATQLAQLIGEQPPKSSGLGSGTSQLVAGIRTGGLRAVAGPASDGSAAESAPLISFDAPAVEMTPGSTWSRLWNAVGKKLVVVGCIAACVTLVAKKVNRLIDTAAVEATRASDVAAKAREEEESTRLHEQSQRAMAQSSESNAQDAIRMLEKARGAFNKENYAEAIEGFDAVIQHHPKRAEATIAEFLRAKALLASGQRSRAITALSEFLDHHSGSADYWEALLRRGQAYHAQLEEELALSDLSQLLQKQPTSPWAAEALVARGEIHARRGATEDASADFRAALARVGPSDPMATRASADLQALTPPSSHP
ncbi:MAG TPA: protein kinase [Myxococcaceae bacterium]|nr:protein kinase [Myxococcaceae bacterium]